MLRSTFYTLSLIVVQSLINIFSNMELDCCSSCVHACVCIMHTVEVLYTEKCNMLTECV